MDYTRVEREKKMGFRIVQAGNDRVSVVRLIISDRHIYLECNLVDATGNSIRTVETSVCCIFSAKNRSGPVENRVIQISTHGTWKTRLMMIKKK